MTIFGYKMITTYRQDFNIADKFGMKAVVDTYNKSIKNENNYKELTELVMVLNHKIWEHHENEDFELAKVYDKLWRTADEFAIQRLKGEELSYYYRTLD